MTGYGQFCPVAKAMELLDERWTMLVVRELLMGSSRFNQLRRGVPRMSPALLSKRLETLQRSGVVVHEADGSYSLTPCGRDLYDVVATVGSWGQRWITDLGDADLDPHLLMWDIQRTVDVDRWPRQRTSVAFAFSDAALRARHWWLMVAEGEAEACNFDPGYDVAATVTTPLSTLTRIWRGDTEWASELKAGRLDVSAPADVRRQLPQWLGTSRLASAVPG